MACIGTCLRCRHNITGSKSERAGYGKNGPEFGKNGPQLSLIFSKVSFKIDFMGLEGPDHKQEAY